MDRFFRGRDRLVPGTGSGQRFVPHRRPERPCGARLGWPNRERLAPCGDRFAGGWRTRPPGHHSSTLRERPFRAVGGSWRSCEQHEVFRLASPVPPIEFRAAEAVVPARVPNPIGVLRYCEVHRPLGKKRIDRFQACASDVRDPPDTTTWTCSTTKVMLLGCGEHQSCAPRFAL